MVRIHFVSVGPERNSATWSQPADLTHPSRGGNLEHLLAYIAEQARHPFPPIDQDRLYAIESTGTTGPAIHGRLELRPVGLERRPRIVGRFIAEVTP